jgi:hypothetical protein
VVKYDTCQTANRTHSSKVQKTLSFSFVRTASCKIYRCTILFRARKRDTFTSPIQEKIFAAALDDSDTVACQGAADRIVHTRKEFDVYGLSGSQTRIEPRGCLLLRYHEHDTSRITPPSLLSSLTDDEWLPAVEL